jgi:RNA polymerase sigma factor (sigma-70 family)
LSQDQPPQDDREEQTTQLVPLLRGHDPRAGERLDQMYRQRMIRCCIGYLGRVEEAEDAVQEVFCKVLTAEHVPDNFRPWIYKIARNHCLNVIRKRNRQGPAQDLPPDSMLHHSQTGHLTKLLKRELHDRLAKLVESLSESQREALRLRYTEGLSRGEIAEIMEIPEKTVKSRLFEGLKKLREHTSLIMTR